MSNVPGSKTSSLKFKVSKILVANKVIMLPVLLINDCGTVMLPKTYAKEQCFEFFICETLQML